MAGMRAALDGVLRRFDPEQLEQRLTDKTFVDSMLPMNRKAKLWSLFAELYADITREAQDDFHALFGKEFLRAYESQLDLLEKHRDGAPNSDKP
jgi:predicted component of type VI protein secretion system